MLLLSTLLLVLTTPISSLPTSSYELDPAAILKPQDHLVHPGSEVQNIAHLARAINAASCVDGDYSSDVVARSKSSDDGDLDVDVTWYISHQHSTNTYTLAFSSSAPEDLLELLASASPDTDHLTPLPSAFLSTCPHHDHGHGHGSIYTPYVPYLDTVEEATTTLSTLMARHRSNHLTNALRSLASFFGFSSYRKGQGSDLPKVEITGHGLGAVLALLSSVRQSSTYPNQLISGTFFSMPKIGDHQFAQSVNRLVDARDGLKLQRVTNGRDPIPSLPPLHFGLEHPFSISEIVLGQEGEVGLGSEMRGRKARIELGRLEDGHGPYGGVVIDQVC